MTICKGLPASGKSTWAKDKVAKSQGSTKRINKDELRELLDGGKYSKSNEAYVLEVRDMLVRQALIQQKNVIIDDTNLHPKHEARIRELVAEHNTIVAHNEDICTVGVTIKDFTHVDPMECIRRDNARANGVGADVIMKMYNQFLKADEDPVQPPEWDPSLPSCIICDIDGTLADNSWRNPFDASQADQDRLIKPTLVILNAIRTGMPELCIALFSGRDGSFEKPTINFLSMYGVPCDMLCMRQEGDSRKDSVVKREMYEKHIKGKYNVLFVMDDRNQVVDMWRKELGLTCHQVNYGDF